MRYDGQFVRTAPGLEIDGERVITSTEALELDAAPKRVLVIGGGPIGAEFASLWNAFGSQVVLVEMMPNLLPMDDAENTKLLATIFKKRGIDVRTETTVKSLDRSKKTVRAILEGKRADDVEVDLVLVGIGRKFPSALYRRRQDLASRWAIAARSSSTSEWKRMLPASMQSAT